MTDIPLDSFDLLFESALQAEDPYEALISVAKEMRDQGVEQRQLYEYFRVCYHRYCEGEEADSSGVWADAIECTADLIVGGGWAKGRDLYDTELMPENFDSDPFYVDKS